MSELTDSLGAENDASNPLNTLSDFINMGASLGAMNAGLASVEVAGSIAGGISMGAENTMQAPAPALDINNAPGMEVGLTPGTLMA